MKTTRQKRAKFLGQSSFEKQQQARIAASRDCYHTAGRLAAENGLSFRRISDTRYVLKSQEWMLHIYPMAQRVDWTPREKRLTLQLENGWTVLDVVKAVVEAMG